MLPNYLPPYRLEHYPKGLKGPYIASPSLAAHLGKRPFFPSRAEYVYWVFVDRKFRRRRRGELGRDHQGPQPQPAPSFDFYEDDHLEDDRRSSCPQFLVNIRRTGRRSHPTWSAIRPCLRTEEETAEAIARIAHWQSTSTLTFDGELSYARYSIAPDVQVLSHQPSFLPDGPLPGSQLLATALNAPVRIESDEPDPSMLAPPSTMCIDTEFASVDNVAFRGLRSPMRAPPSSPVRAAPRFHERPIAQPGAMSEDCDVTMLIATPPRQVAHPVAPSFQPPVPTLLQWLATSQHDVDMEDNIRAQVVEPLHLPGPVFTSFSAFAPAAPSQAAQDVPMSPQAANVVAPSSTVPLTSTPPRAGTLLLRRSPQPPTTPESLFGDDDEGDKSLFGDDDEDDKDDEDDCVIITGTTPAPAVTFNLAEHQYMEWWPPLEQPKPQTQTQTLPVYAAPASLVVYSPPTGPLQSPTLDVEMGTSDAEVPIRDIEMGSSETEMPPQDIEVGPSDGEASIRDVKMASPTSKVQHTRLPHVRSVIRPLRPLPVRSASRPLPVPISVPVLTAPIPAIVPTTIPAYEVPMALGDTQTGADPSMAEDDAAVIRAGLPLPLLACRPAGVVEVKDIDMAERREPSLPSSEIKSSSGSDEQGSEDAELLRELLAMRRDPNEWYGHAKPAARAVRRRIAKVIPVTFALADLTLSSSDESLASDGDSDGDSDDEGLFCGRSESDATIATSVDPEVCSLADSLVKLNIGSTEEAPSSLSLVPRDPVAVSPDAVPLIKVGDTEVSVSTPVLASNATAAGLSPYKRIISNVQSEEASRISIVWIRGANRPSTKASGCRLDDEADAQLCHPGPASGSSRKHGDVPASEPPVHGHNQEKTSPTKDNTSTHEEQATKTHELHPRYVGKAMHKARLSTFDTSPSLIPPSRFWHMMSRRPLTDRKSNTANAVQGSGASSSSLRPVTRDFGGPRKVYKSTSKLDSGKTSFSAGNDNGHSGLARATASSSKLAHPILAGTTGSARGSTGSTGNRGGYSGSSLDSGILKTGSGDSQQHPSSASGKRGVRFRLPSDGLQMHDPGFDAVPHAVVYNWSPFSGPSLPSSRPPRVSASAPISQPSLPTPPPIRRLAPPPARRPMFVPAPARPSLSTRAVSLVRRCLGLAPR